MACEGHKTTAKHIVRRGAEVYFALERICCDQHGVDVMGSKLDKVDFTKDVASITSAALSPTHHRSNSIGKDLKRYWDSDLSALNDGNHTWEHESRGITMAAQIDDAVLQFCEGFDGSVEVLFPSQGKGKRGKRKLIQRFMPRLSSGPKTKLGETLETHLCPMGSLRPLILGYRLSWVTGSI